MKSTNQTLGQKLKSLQQTSAEELRRQQAQADAVRSSEARAALEAVEGLFKRARATFVDRINSGRLPGEVKIHSSTDQRACAAMATYRWNDPRQSIEDVRHPYHFVWKDFVQWGADNEVEPYLEYQHDGVGIESWHCIKLRALDTAPAN